MNILIKTIFTITWSIHSTLFPFHVSPILLNIFHIYNLRDRVDKSMDNIEKGIKLKNSEMICIESKKLSKLILRKQIELKRIEPYYDWNEINLTLIQKGKDHCKERSKH